MMIYVNGEVIAEEAAKISAFDHGYMYGLGVFETFRVYNGHPFLLDDHFRRLQDSLQVMGIESGLTKERMFEVVNRLLSVNGLENRDAYIRWNVSAGAGEIGLQTEMYTKPTTVVYVKKIPQVMNHEKEVKILEIRRNTPETPLRLKSHHYLNNVLAKREIGNDPAIEGVFLDEKGYLAEGVVSNLFWVKDNIVYTPSIHTGILNGITRQFLIDVLKKEGFVVKQGLYLTEELLRADEAFLTNSIQEVVTVVGVNHQLYQKEPRVSMRLQSLYRDYRHVLFSRAEL